MLRHLFVLTTQKKTSSPFYPPTPTNHHQADDLTSLPGKIDSCNSMRCLEQKRRKMLILSHLEFPIEVVKMRRNERTK